MLQIPDNLHIPEHSILVTIDVEALYSLIPHDKGLVGIMHILHTKATHEQAYNEFIIPLLEFILKHHIFTFNGSQYLHIQGVAMGTCCAPAYANLYLGEWEQMLFTDELMLMYTDHISAWYHYINNIFVIWKGPTETLEQFLMRLNKNEFNLGFTMSHDRDCIAFLDISIYRGDGGTLYSSLYRKPTEGNHILHALSFHPKTLEDSIS